MNIEQEARRSIAFCALRTLKGAKRAGYSYFLHRHAKRNVAGDGESGLLAAKAILAARGTNSPALSETYRSLLAQRFGKVQEE